MPATTRFETASAVGAVRDWKSVLSRADYALAKRAMEEYFPEQSPRSLVATLDVKPQVDFSRSRSCSSDMACCASYSEIEQAQRRNRPSQFLGMLRGEAEISEPDVAVARQKLAARETVERLRTSSRDAMRIVVSRKNGAVAKAPLSGGRIGKSCGVLR